MTGSALGQGFALLISPIITRLFSVEDFSAFEQYAFLLSAFTVVVTGKYEFAIMHPGDREDARHIAGLALRIAAYFCIGLLLILIVTSGYIAEFVHQPNLKYWLWTLPVALFAVAIFNVVNFWFSRQKEYKVAAISKVIYSTSGEPIKILAGYFYAGTGGLVAGTVFGHIASALYAWRKFVQNESQRLRNLSKEKLRKLASTHADYPRYTVWGGLLNNLAQWAHIAVFVFFYEEKAIIPIGMIALSRRIFFNPLGLLSTSYGQVFYQQISEIKSGIELKDFYLKNLSRFLLVAAAMVAIVQALPDNTLGFIFGNEWKDALVYLKILCYWYSLNFVIGTLSFIFYRLQLQWLTLVADIFHFLIVIAAFWLAWNNGEDELGAIRYMVIAKVFYLLLNGGAMIYYLHQNSKKEEAGL